MKSLQTMYMYYKSTNVYIKNKINLENKCTMDIDRSTHPCEIGRFVI